MKKMMIILAIFSITFVFENSKCSAEIAEGTWTVTKQDGKLNGVWPFRWVGFSSTHQDPSTRTLTCTGEGVNKCEIMGLVSSGLLEHTNDLIDDINIRIHSGVLSGSINKNIYCPTNQKYYYSTAIWATENNESCIIINNIPVED